MARKSANRPTACRRPGRDRPSARRNPLGDDPRGEVFAADRIAGLAPISGERPVCPDLHALCAQLADVSAPGQEPQQLARRRLPVDALGGQQRHRPAGKVEAQLGPEQRPRADPGAVLARVALLPDAAHQIEVLPFPMRRPPAHRSHIRSTVATAPSAATLPAQYSAIQPSRVASGAGCRGGSRPGFEDRSLAHQ